MQFGSKINRNIVLSKLIFLVLLQHSAKKISLLHCDINKLYLFEEQNLVLGSVDVFVLLGILFYQILLNQDSSAYNLL